ncbi:MAG: hypothetical protein WC716_15450 [Chitinophagaceae bacterium]
MENLAAKEEFLRSEFVAALRTINPNTAPLFGKMNPQQMVEHMAEYIRLGYGNPVVTQFFYTAESVERTRAFIMSDKPFKENTPNPIMGETPKPIIQPTYEAAIKDAEMAIKELFEAFGKNDKLEVASPFFGILNYEMTIQLLTKHAEHHLRQFGIKS